MKIRKTRDVISSASSNKHNRKRNMDIPTLTIPNYEVASLLVRDRNIYIDPVSYYRAFIKW